MAFYFSCSWCMDDRAFDGLDFLPSVGIIFLRGKREYHIGTGLEATRPSRPGTDRRLILFDDYLDVCVILCNERLSKYVSSYLLKPVAVVPNSFKKPC